MNLSRLVAGYIFFAAHSAGLKQMKQSHLYPAGLNAEPQKLYKLLGNMFSKMKIKTGDVFLVWRIKELINAGKLEAGSDWTKGWKEITIKLAGTPVESEAIGE